MKFEIRTTQRFEKEVKRLLKKYTSLKTDLIDLEKSLQVNPKQGVALGKNFYKIRFTIKSKGKGKSGGARVITNIIVSKINEGSIDRLYLAAIYDKADIESISEKDLQEIIKQIKLSK